MRVVFAKYQLLVFFSFLAAVAALVLLVSQQSSSSPAPAKSEVASAVKQARQDGVPKRYATAYVREAEKQGLDWQMLAAIGFAESAHGKTPLPGIRSGINLAGCCAGPLQVCVVEACGNVAGQYGRDGNGDGKVDIYRPEDAVATGANYLEWLRGVVGSRPALLAAAYNAGPTVVSSLGAVPDYPETKEYVRKVLRYRQRLLEKKL